LEFFPFEKFIAVEVKDAKAKARATYENLK
jgi:hypothetical protein